MNSHIAPVGPSGTNWKSTAPCGANITHDVTRFGKITSLGSPLVTIAKKRYTASNRQLAKLKNQPFIVIAVPLVWRDRAIAAEYDFELPEGAEHLDATLILNAKALTTYAPGNGTGLTKSIGHLDSSQLAYAGRHEILVLCDVIVVHDKKDKHLITKEAVDSSPPAWATLMADDPV